MKNFETSIGIISAVCLGVMALAIFFALLRWIHERLRKPAVFKLQGLFDVTKFLTVYLNSGKIMVNIKFIGFTDPDRMRGVPYPLTQMVVFENAEGNRVLLRPETIRIIEEGNLSTTIYKSERDRDRDAGARR